jgi:hypothetical protein
MIYTKQTDRGIIENFQSLHIKRTHVESLLHRFGKKKRQMFAANREGLEVEDLPTNWRVAKILSKRRSDETSRNGIVSKRNSGETWQRDETAEMMMIKDSVQKATNRIRFRRGVKLLDGGIA